MMGASINIDMAEITQRLGTLSERLGNLRPLMENIGATLLLSSQMRIEQTKKAPDGSAWTPLARSTIRKRMKAGTLGGGILKIHGDLLRSLNYRADDQSVTISMGGSGRSMDYARIHQFGGTIERQSSQRTLHYGETGNLWVKRSQSKRTKTVNVGGYTITLPARPVLGLSQEDEEDIREAVQSYTAEALGE
jgi:phage virion morphogenesis protein